MFRLFITTSVFWMAVSLASAQSTFLTISLDGAWLFAADSQKVGLESQWFLDSTDRSGWNPVQTPSSLETFPGLTNYDGWGWYARRFSFEKTSQAMSIHFAGVDDDAVVWVNGRQVGSHDGYSEPFALDVTDALRSGENTIVVLVKDYGGRGGIYKPVTLTETRHLDDLLKSKYFGTPALKSADWVKDAIIYSVYLRSFSREGTFKGLERRISELQEIGITVLWLLPIHPVGIKNRKGTLGSPYSVRDYYAINAEFGTMQDFKRLLATVHKQGMKLIIDLVANHTSWDSRLIHEHPDWFARDRHGNFVSPNADWTDVAKLDYGNRALRKYMIEMMRWWVRDIGIDGFRCDVAELVPTEFWEEARLELNKIKPVMMLSEGSVPEHHVKAFDISYSWNIYDALEPLLKGKRPATTLDQILKNEYLQYPSSSLRLRFNTNHDKNAWDAPAVTKFGTDGLKLTAVLINTLPGVPLLYTGEEVANDKKLSLFEKVDVDWSRPRAMERLYRALFHLRDAHKSLQRGAMIRVATSNDPAVYAYFRSAGNDRILTVLNFATDSLTTRLQVPFEKVFPGKNSMVLNDVFSGKRIAVVAENGGELELTLEPRGYRVFSTEN